MFCSDPDPVFKIWSDPFFKTWLNPVVFRNSEQDQDSCPDFSRRLDPNSVFSRRSNPDPGKCHPDPKPPGFETYLGVSPLLVRVGPEESSHAGQVVRIL